MRTRRVCVQLQIANPPMPPQERNDARVREGEQRVEVHQPGEGHEGREDEGVGWVGDEQGKAGLKKEDRDDKLNLIKELQKRLRRVKQMGPFEYSHQGSLAYIGSEKVCFSFPRSLTSSFDILDDAYCAIYRRWQISPG